jgi:hypothetical protein
VILMAPLAAPVDVSFSEAVRFVLCPAAIFTGVVIPERLMPVPVTLTPEIVNSDSPELLKRMVCVVVLPVGTVPKLMEAGVTERAGDDDEAVAVALQPIASDEFVALLMTVSAPEAFPAFVGLKTALRLALAPDASVRGRGGLDTEMPAPEAETAEIVMLDEPVFVREIDWVDCDPTVTVPKLSDAGVAFKSEGFATPVAVKATTIGEFGALLLIITFPLAGPVAAAVKVADTLAV